MLRPAQSMLLGAARRSMQAGRLVAIRRHSHHAVDDLKHFEVNTPQDAIPFSVRNNFWWGVKLSAVTVIGLGAPVFIVYWQM